MVRISDILKQKGQPPEPKPSEEKKEEPLKEEPRGYTKEIETEPAEGIQVGKAMTQEEPQAQEEMQVVKAMREVQLDPEESAKIYNRALEVIKGILNKGQSKEAFIDLREAYEITKIIVDRIVLGDKELISLTTNYTEDNYLYAHTVNNCILSIDLGLGLGYNKSKLNDLGLGALLHDVGMMEVMDIANQPRILNENEFAEIKKHPVYSSDILSKIKDIREGVVYIVTQAHERLNGTGYPKGIKGNQIHEYAKIVGLVDVYEALTHPRPHRKAFQPYEAIKELLTISSGLFEMRVLKVLINRIGLYPVGSWVELNTGEIAKVISSHEDVPLRPKVNIIFGQDKERLEDIRSIDLSRHVSVYIKCGIDPKELNLS